MYSSIARQAVMMGMLVVVLCSTLLLGVLLQPKGNTGARASQTGIMLIAPPSYGQSLIWQVPARSVSFS